MDKEATLLSDFINNIKNYKYNLDEFLDKEIVVDVNINSLETLMFSFSDKKVEEKVWKYIINNIDNKVLSKKVIDYLINNDIALMELAHSDISSDYLILIGEKGKDDEFLEAFQTVGLRLLNNNDEFDSFIKKNYSEQLAIFLFERIIFSDKDLKEQLRSICEAMNNRNSERASIYGEYVFLRYSEDTHKLEEASKSKHYVILMSIAKNKCTPNYVLKDLSNIHNIKYRKIINKIAKNNLDSKMNPNTDGIG